MSDPNLITPPADPNPTPETPATPNPSSEWLSSLPEAYRADPAISKFQSMEDLVKSQIGYAKMHGVPGDQLMRLPKADDAEGWKAFAERVQGDALLGAMGRPATPADYQFNGIDLKNEGDKAFVEGFRDIAHKAGTTQAQMDAILGYLGQSLATVDGKYAEMIEQNRAAAKAELAKVWGDKAAVYEKELPGVVQKLAAKAGIENPDKVYEALNADGLTDNPTFMRMLAAMADMTAEGGNLPGVGKGGAEGGIPADQAEAQKQLNEFAQSPDYVKMHDNRTPSAERQALKDKWAALSAAAAGVATA